MVIGKPKVIWKFFIVKIKEYNESEVTYKGWQMHWTDILEVIIISLVAAIIIKTVLDDEGKDKEDKDEDDVGNYGHH